MKTAYGKLTALILILAAALLFLSPMRSGTEDHLYAYPRALRMNSGDQYALSYTLDAAGAQTVSFDSSDEAVARVDDQGVVTAVGPGETQIRLISEGGARAAVQVEVAGGAPVSPIALNTETLNMEKGEVTGLRVTYTDNGADASVQWQSEDSRIAQVDAMGRVNAVGGGRTRVTATTADGLSAVANVNVHVSGDAIRITPENLVLGKGATVSLSTYYLPADTTDSVMRWRSSDESILRVDDRGQLSAVGEGAAVVSVATREGLKASSLITVEPAAATFQLSPSAASIERGDTLKLQARFLDADGVSEQTYVSHYISWSSSAPDVASVNDGVVTALKSGQTVITASADGKTATCRLSVQVIAHDLELNPKEVYLLREQSVTPIQLEPRFTPEDPDDARLTFETSNSLIATVSDTGLVRMTGGYGTAVITARAVSGAEAEFVIHVVDQLPEVEPEPVEEEAPEGGE